MHSVISAKVLTVSFPVELVKNLRVEYCSFLGSCYVGGVQSYPTASIENVAGGFASDFEPGRQNVRSENRSSTRQRPQDLLARCCKY